MKRIGRLGEVNGPRSGGEIADWYENDFLARQAGGDPLGIRGALADLLGAGRGVCVEIGCGTGVYAAQVRELGWTSVGVDVSAGMLRHARGRLPVARADAGHCRSATVPRRRSR